LYLFDSTNYYYWIDFVVTSLSAKNKLQFVDGFIDPPPAMYQIIPS